MWPIKKDEKSIIKKAFGKYINNILNGHNDLSEKTVQYILMFVKETDYFQETIKTIFDIVQEHDGMIESMTGSLISVLFNVPLDQPDSEKKRLLLISALSERVGSDLTIVHGQCICPVGSLGNEKRLCYTAIIQDYKSKINKLSSLAFGEIVEL